MNKIINISPNKNYYKKLILDNCIHNNTQNKLNIYYLDLLYKIIIYGNIKSKCKKNLNLHTRLYNINDIEKHQLSHEFNSIKGYNFIFDKLVFIFLLIIIIQYITYFISSNKN